MKRLSIILILASFMTVVVPSCSFLDEFPTTNLVDKQIYENLESANSALEGCYQSLLGLYGSHFLNHIQGGSVLQYNHSGQQDSWFNHTLYSSHASNANVYKNVYSSISKCNSFIDCASASELPEEWVKESIAQARFVRAYTYFFATRIWGDLPLILDKVNLFETGLTKISFCSIILKFSSVKQ